MRTSCDKLIAVIKKCDVAVGKAADIVLVGKCSNASQHWIANKGELIILAAESPDNLPRVTVNFGDLAEMTAREEQVPVAIQLYGVAMYVVDDRS